MRRYDNHKICFIAFLLLIFAAGCSDPDKTGVNPGVTPPTVISVTPLRGAINACPNSTVTATFSKAMNPASLNTTTFTLTGPATTSITGQVTYDASSDTAIFTPSSSLALSTTCTATITTGAKDVFGNALASNFVWTFTTANPCQPPIVISVTPPNGTSVVCPSSAVTATFSEAMNPATINATTFTLAGPGATPVTGVVTYAVSTATFTPSSPLAVNTAYIATITTGAKDVFGNALVNNFVWGFKTGGAACPPTVISVAPPNGSSGICPNTLVTATFSEAMKTSTINTTTFTLTGPGITSVPGTVTYVASSDVATFTPTSPLALDAVYTATITTGAQDLAGGQQSPRRRYPEHHWSEVHPRIPIQRCRFPGSAPAGGSQENQKASSQEKGRAPSSTLMYGCAPIQREAG